MVLRLWRKSKASRTGVARFWFLNVLLADFNVLMTDLWLQGIYYDLLHICDLALYCDMYASSFLVWTVGRNIFDARTKDERLVELYSRYMVWCKENRILFLFHLVWPFLYSYVTKIVFFFPPQKSEATRHMYTFSFHASKVFQVAVAPKQLCSYLQHFKIHPSPTLRLDKRN